jgi:hypothetical protein
MTALEQRKLQTLFEAMEKEVHFMVVDILASMCRPDDISRQPPLSSMEGVAKKLADALESRLEGTDPPG